MNRRWPALVVLAVAVATLAGASVWRDAPSPSSPLRAAPLSATPQAGRARNATWYCAAGTAARGAAFNSTVLIASVDTQLRRGTITWFPSAGKPVSLPFQVQPNTVVSFVAADTVTAPVVSALVEIDGGDVAVEHAISGASGSSVAPCANEASSKWYVAEGVTDRDAHEVLALFNPFPDTAVVDIDFATDQGRAQPRDVQGLPLPPRSTTFVNVQDIVRRRAVVAASVVARTGRLVVDRIQLFDATAGRAGVSLAVAAARGDTTWRFPDGLFQFGLAEQWHIYNPTDDEAAVTLTVTPVTGDAPDPLQIAVPRHAIATVDAGQAKVPAAIAHSSVVESQNGVPVIVERTLDARRPAPRVGWSSMVGAPVTATRWLFAAGEANTNTDEWMVLQNPGTTSVTVSLLALADGFQLPIEDAHDLTVPPNGRLAVRLGDHITRSPLPLLVVSSGPVVAERDAFALKRAGVSAVAGVPLP